LHVSHDTRTRPFAKQSGHDSNLDDLDANPAGEASVADLGPGT
jgi:hypothetical protein